MVKGILAIVVGLACAPAFANDGGIAVVDVLGIAPGTLNASGVDVYGHSTGSFYGMLPETAVPQVRGKSIAFASGAWVLRLDCAIDYRRPAGNHELRDDHLCTFAVTTRKASAIDDPDANASNILDSTNGFSFLSSDNTIGVLGVNPKTTVKGQLFSFYGGQTALFAEKLPATGVGGRSGVTMASGKWVFDIACKRDYVRPSNGESRNDYMCTGSLYPR